MIKIFGFESLAHRLANHCRLRSEIIFNQKAKEKRKKEEIALEFSLSKNLIRSESSRAAGAHRTEEYSIGQFA